MGIIFWVIILMVKAGLFHQTIKMNCMELGKKSKRAIAVLYGNACYYLRVYWLSLAGKILLFPTSSRKKLICYLRKTQNNIQMF